MYAEFTVSLFLQKPIYTDRIGLYGQQCEYRHFFSQLFK